MQQNFSHKRFKSLAGFLEIIGRKPGGCTSRTHMIDQFSPFRFRILVQTVLPVCVLQLTVRIIPHSARRWPGLPVLLTQLHFASLELGASAMATKTSRGIIGPSRCLFTVSWRNQHNCRHTRLPHLDASKILAAMVRWRGSSCWMRPDCRGLRLQSFSARQ